MPRRLLLVFTITAAALVAAAWAGPEPAPEPLPGGVLARVESAVVIVETFDADAEFLGPVAAFFAEPDWLITNLHCVEGVSEAVVNLGERGVVRVDGVVAGSERLDVVALRTQIPSGTLTPRKLSDRPAARRSPVAVVVRDGVGKVAVSPGRVVREVLQGAPGSAVTTAPAWHGCSGSPLVGHDGAVIGVVNTLHGDHTSDMAKAAAAYLKALDHVPTVIQSAIGYAAALEGQGRATDAVLWLSKLLREKRESAAGWEVAGGIYLRAGQQGGSASLRVLRALRGEADGREKCARERSTPGSRPRLPLHDWSLV